MTQKELEDFVAAAERVRKEVTATPEKARQFLMDSGYLDKNGDVAAPYRSALGDKQ